MGTPKKTWGFGVLSALMTYAVLVVVASRADLMGIIGPDLTALLSGRVGDIVRGTHDMGAMGLFIVTIIALELPLAIVTTLAVTALLGKSKGEHEVGNVLDKLTHGHNFMSFFALVLLEELGARWFFLGVIPWIGTRVAWLGFLASPVAFYILFLVGNSLWSAIHLPNYKEKEDRNPLRVLTQFMGGVFFTYVFVKYGLLATLLTHFGSNAVLFALHKRQRINIVDALITLYSLACTVGTWLLMSKSISDAGAWLRQVPSFALPGWTTWDYILLSTFVSHGISFLFGIMLYDRGEAGKAIPRKPGESAKEAPAAQMLFIMPAAMAAIIGILYSLYWMLGMVTTDTPTRVLLVAILFSLINRGASGSAVARTFWGDLPSMFVTMCILEALGFWNALGYLGAILVINYPNIALCKHDD